MTLCLRWVRSFPIMMVVPPPRVSAMMPTGTWNITMSNDPWLSRLPRPWEVQVNGEMFSFSRVMRGKFVVLKNHSVDEFGVRMLPYNLQIMGREYTMKVMGPSRVCLSQGDVYYLLDRVR